MRGKLATVALRTSLLYALIAGIWILISDKVVVAFFSDPTVIGQISMYKGWAFVATTALLLYLALRADLRRWETEAMERKRAEDALASEVDMRRALFARSPDGVLIIDPETARPIEFNDAAHRQLGYTREEFARLSIFDLEAVETPEETRTRIQGVFREGRADFETRHRTKQGELRNVHVTAQVIKVQGREVYHCIWRDITERKRAEAAVRKSEERYRRLFEANPHPMWLYDVQTLAFLEVNDAAVTHYGFSREEFLGMTIADIRPAEDVPRLLVNIAHVGERCVDEAGTWRHRRKDGSIIWVEITSHVLEYLGHPAELVLAHDVTERLRAEAALRAGEERLNRILETIPDGIAIVNLEGQITFANSGAERLFALKRSNITQRTYNDPAWKITTLEGQPFPDDQQPFRRVLQSGQPVYGIEQVLEHAEGRRVILSINAAPLRDATGGLLGTVAAFTDVTERKQAEHDLRDSEERYRRLFNASTDAIFVHRMLPDGRPGLFIEASEAAVRRYGYCPEEWLQMSPLDIDAPEGLEVLAEAMARLHREGRATWEGMHLTREGRKIPVEISNVLFTFRGESLALATVRDITERKQVEDAIRRSEASLARAQRVAHLGSWEIDLALGILTWSDETYGIFGVNRTTFNLTREAFLKLVHVEDRERLQQAVRESIRTGQPYNCDHRIVRPDGAERIVSERADVPMDARGQAIRLVGTVQDVTELKRIEQALQRSEKHFRSIIDTVQDVISIVEANGQIRFVSPSAERALGYTPEQLLDREILEFIPDEEHEAVRESLARALGEPHQPVAIQHHFRHADGSLRLLESVGSLLGEETAQALVVNSRDITDRRRLEEQLRQAQKMEAIGQLAAGVAHDFNNLLTIIQGNASLLLGTPGLSSEDASSTAQIVEAAERAAGLTRQLLMFSRKQVMRLATLDLNEVVGNMTKMLQRILGEDVTLRSEYAPNLPLIQADTGMLEQVLLNLAVNARDAMPDGGQLVIQTLAVKLDLQDLGRHPEAATGAHVRLSVADTGSGIAPENLPRIFDPFFTTKEVGKGTGLGLATVYGIVKQHRGWVEVSSELSEGTTFQIYLPVAEGITATQRGGDVIQELPRGNETILVVEDEPAVRLLVNNLLQRCGYTVLLAGSGVAALDVWKEHKDRIALLLTDMVMPDGLSGRELASRLQQERPNLKVIYSSGYSATVGGKGPELMEGVNFLQKPYPPHHLARTVRDCLDRR